MQPTAKPTAQVEHGGTDSSKYRPGTVVKIKLEPLFSPRLCCGGVFMNISARGGLSNIETRKVS